MKINESVVTRNELTNKFVGLGGLGPVVARCPLVVRTTLASLLCADLDVLICRGLWFLREI